MPYRIVVESSESGVKRVISDNLSKENANRDADRVRQLVQHGWSVTVEPELVPPLRRFRIPLTGQSR